LQVLLDQVCPDGVVTLADAVWPVGGGLHVDVPLSLVGEGTATLDLLGDGRVDAHAPARLEGLVVTNGRATGLGGCVRGADGLELVDVVVSGCAVDPEPVLADAAAEACWTGACGGCVFASGAVTASGVVLEDCAAAAGGGLWVGGSGVLTDVVVDGTRTEASRVHAGFGTAGTDGGCALGRCGGGVYARGPLVLADVRIEGSVGTDGAGLYTTSDVDAVGLEVVGTTSSAGAGAIAHDGASFACTGCSLRHNHTDDGFRPSALESDGVVMLADTEVVGNHPDVVPAVYACQPGQVGCTARWTLVDTVFDREPCSFATTCGSGVTLYGLASTVVGGSSLGMVLGGEVSVVGHHMPGGSLALLFPDGPVEVRDTRLDAGRIALIGGEGGTFANLALLGDSGDPPLRLDSSGGAVVVDQVTFVGASSGLRFQGSSAYTVTDVVGQGPSTVIAQAPLGTVARAVFGIGAA
ncbi:MAG: hypothetical protein KC656_31065, partial [Myxococcales bacterium]|nr:hypothetical protein [Myxococcales bacterium]